MSDTGTGIPRNELAKVFDRFRQVEDGARGKPSGTGLGLSICRELVSRMGGSIWAESQEGVGSRFHFTLPIAGEPGVRTPHAEPEPDHEVVTTAKSDAPTASSDEPAIA